MSFSFISCKIKGLYEVQPQIIQDNRGYFLESYCQKDFYEAGLNLNFVQDNQSLSTKNVIRGLHFQKNHPQGKLIRTLQGTIYDVAVDLRNESPTFGQYCGIILDSNKQNMFYIPEGFAHGFCVLSESAVISYKCSDFYYPEDEAGIIWNDPVLNINWASVCKDLNSNCILSNKDLKNQNFSFENKYYDINGKWIGNN